MPAARTYSDGKWDQATAAEFLAVSPFVKQVALDGINELLVGTQDYTCQRDSFIPLALNTAHPDDSNFVLVKEDNFQNLGGDIVQWTRTYAKNPAAWDNEGSYSEPGGTMAYAFIGFVGVTGINVDAVTGRERQVQTVGVRLHREFFLTGPGQTYEDPNDIPIIEEQEYFYGDPSDGLKTDFLGDSPPLDEETTPSRTEYVAMITGGDEIPVQASVVTRWMGNIFMRETRYVLAK